MADPAVKPVDTVDQKTDQASDQQSQYMTAAGLNGALTSRERRLEARLTALVEKQLEAQFVKFKSSLNPIATETVEETPDGVQKNAPASDPAIKRQSAKIDALMKQMQLQSEAAAKEKSELLQKQERSDMISALTAAGSMNANGAYALMKDQGRVRRNAAGDLVVVLAKDFGDDEIAYTAGIKEWLNTDEGKHYLPPRGGGDGSGTVIRGGAPRGSGAQMSKEEAKREAQRTLAAFVLGSNK